MDKIRQFLDSVPGKISVGVLLLIGAVALFFSVRDTFGDPDAIADTRVRHFVCSETGKSFELTVEEGMDWPVESPYSGKPTGYPAEACYWTKDGTIKSDPTYVLVNHYLDKPGPSFCPDCGRLVRPRNPPPLEGEPPPTEAEYKQRGGPSGRE